MPFRKYETPISGPHIQNRTKYLRIVNKFWKAGKKLKNFFLIRKFPKGVLNSRETRPVKGS